MFQLIMPGYCVAGTIGHKVLSGAKKIEIDKKVVNVKLSVQYMSFSAHADAKGIMQLIRQAAPRNVLLVHGEAAKMEFLKQKVMQEFGINCLMPANGETAIIQTVPTISVDMSRVLFKRSLDHLYSSDSKRVCQHHPRAVPTTGLLIMRNETLQILDFSEAQAELGLVPHDIRFSSSLSLDTRSRPPHEFMENLLQIMVKLFPDQLMSLSSSGEYMINVEDRDVFVEVTSFEPMQDILVNWNAREEALGEFIFSTLQRNLSRLL